MMLELVARCACTVSLQSAGVPDTIHAVSLRCCCCVLLSQDRIRIACETVSALVFLHSAPEPIIHMDLKPGNLLLNRSLLCKVRQQQRQQQRLRKQACPLLAASAYSLCPNWCPCFSSTRMCRIAA
jgi:hypothetical protein